ncbi:MAG: SDR family oxidoreductase [Armatimonadetes bacterium]|jgi:UDP-glucose 4-epimerase|nr:SDR family oxidoreductase [Armatimonadota bacterium]
MATFLVTGGAGFIGSNITRALLEAGDTVRVLDNFATGRRDNLSGIEESVALFEEDIRDLEAIRPAFEGADYVLHQAALPSVPRSVKDPVSTTEANVNGTLNVLIAARDAGVKRVVMASSSSVYGSNPELPKHEGMRPLPISPYAASKLADEAYAASFTHVYGLETVCLRYFNVFGPRQDPTSQYAAVIPLFVTLLLRGERPTIFGDGEQSRDFTYVANVIQANIRAATSPGGSGQAFNIACGSRISLNELLAHLNDIIGTNIEPIYTESRPGDVKHSLADISAAREAFGYDPQVSTREGLEHVVEWYRQAGG